MTQHKPRRVQLVVFTILEGISYLTLLPFIAAIGWIGSKSIDKMFLHGEEFIPALSSGTFHTPSALALAGWFTLMHGSYLVLAILGLYLFSATRSEARYYKSRARGIEGHVVTVKVTQAQRPAGMVLVYGTPQEKATYVPVPPTLKGVSLFTDTKALLQHLDTPVESVPVITDRGAPVSATSTEEVEGHPMKVFRDGHWQDRD